MQPVCAIDRRKGTSTTSTNASFLPTPDPLTPSTYLVQATREGGNAVVVRAQRDVRYAGRRKTAFCRPERLSAFHTSRGLSGIESATGRTPTTGACGQSLRAEEVDRREKRIGALAKKAVS